MTVTKNIYCQILLIVHKCMSNLQWTPWYTKTFAFQSKSKIFCHPCLAKPSWTMIQGPHRITSLWQVCSWARICSDFWPKNICEHILADDCFKEYDHDVLAIEVNGLKYITIFHEMTKFSLTPSYSSYKLEVHGQEIEMIENTLV